MQSSRVFLLLLLFASLVHGTKYLQMEDDFDDDYIDYSYYGHLNIPHGPTNEASKEFGIWKNNSVDKEKRKWETPMDVVECELGIIFDIEIDE